MREKWFDFNGRTSACKEISNADCHSIMSIWAEELGTWLFLKDCIYLLLDGGQGSEKERERNSSLLPPAPVATGDLA